METKLSGLNELLATLPEPKHSAHRTYFAGFRSSKRDVVPTDPTPADFSCQCEHGATLTEFQFRSLAVLPNRWYAKHSVPTAFDCIFETHPTFFKLLDGKLRTIFPGGITSSDAFRKAVEGLV
jgi:hypothetical protein